MHKIVLCFSLFIIYSFIGWCIEVVAVSYTKKKFVNRGFLIGPYCPIYGVSALVMVFLLNKYKEDISVLFWMSFIVCSIIEYLTSYIMEKLFKARWWDYSDRLFNVNGRICLKNSICFGALGVLLIRYINNFLMYDLNLLSYNILYSLNIILFVCFTVDLFISFNVICKIKKTTVVIKKDYTEEITEKVKNIVSKSSFLSRRLVNAFPTLTIFGTFIKPFKFRRNKKKIFRRK